MIALIYSTYGVNKESKRYKEGKIKEELTYESREKSLLIRKRLVL